ncbi:MAG: hypothetical protein K8T25_16440 [Planctomycetia bacterium]|nr:hypothetical protein [Planctomycetia bacterium]
MKHVLSLECRPSFRRWVWLASPLLLIAVEVGLLTPAVEYVRGPMRKLAAPGVADTALVAGLLMLLVCGGELATTGRLGAIWARVVFLILNVASFALLFFLSLALVKPGWSEGVEWSLAAAWAALAGVVGITAVLACFSVGTLVDWTHGQWHRAIGFLIIGASLALFTPDIQRLWHTIDRPAVKVAYEALNTLHGGRGVTYRTDTTDNPVLGVQGRIPIEVTQACAEVESLAALLVLAVTLLLADRRGVRPLRWLVVAAAGLVLLYALNAVRLFLLVEISIRTGRPGNAVLLAHSRLSGMLFLAVSAGLLMATRPWWRPRLTSKHE